MLFKVLFGALSLDSSIALRLRKIQMHLLAEELETVHLIDGILRRVCTVEYDECLSFALQTLLRDNVDDGAIFLEYFAQSLNEGWYFYALLEIFDLYG